MRQALIILLLISLFTQINCVGKKIQTEANIDKIKTKTQLEENNISNNDYVIITDDRLVQEDAENYFASWVQVSLWSDETYLFHLDTLHYNYNLVLFYLAKRFEQHQKIIKDDLVGKPFYYVLYKLKFYNSLVKLYCYEFNRCSGFMFFDPESKRLLILYVDCYRDGKDYRDQLKYLESFICTGIEYFDLKKRIYEFAGFMPQYDVKDDKIIIIKDVFEGIFPGIDKDYWFEVELKIDKEIKEIFGEGFASITPFNSHLYFLDKQTRKQFEKIKNRFEKREKIKVLETNEMKSGKETGDDERVKNAIKEYLGKNKK